MDIKNPQDWSNAATTVIAVASVLCPPQPPKLL